MGVIGNADFYYDLDGDSAFASAATGQAAANTYNLQQLVAASNVTKVSFPATTSAGAATTMLDTNYDTKAVSGFYLIDGAGAVAGTNYPAFTCVKQGAILPAAAIYAGGAVANLNGKSLSDITAQATQIGGVALAAASATLGFSDRNVRPSAVSLAAGSTGSGMSIDVYGQGGGAAPVIVINNPGSGYVAGDVLDFSVATIPQNAATVTGGIQITLVGGNIPAAGVVSWFGSGTITAGAAAATGGIVAGWLLDVGAAVNTSVAAIPQLVVCQQTLQPVDAQRGDFEDGNNNLNANNTPIAIPEINVQMRSEAIVAKTKKLKAVWTPEFAQDLNAYHSLDAEAELTSIMSEYISLEIDQEILAMLIELSLIHI